MVHQALEKPYLQRQWLVKRIPTLHHLAVRKSWQSIMGKVDEQSDFFILMKKGFLRISLLIPHILHLVHSLLSSG
jgi:predicted Holliday junction resolvase-like endonuclease